MKRLVLAAVVGLGLLVCLPSAWAQKSGYTLALGVPINYHFTKDETTQTAPDAKSPSGLRIMLETPIHLGFGFASYKSGFKDPGSPFFGRDITYRMAEVQLTANFNAWLIGLGFGRGTAQFDPMQVTLPGPITQVFFMSEARETYVMLGLMLGDRWDVRFGYHALVIDAEFTNNGVPGKGDLGALMATLGVGYHY